MTKEEYSELFRKTEGKLFDYKRIKSAIEKIELENFNQIYSNKTHLIKQDIDIINVK